MGFSTSLSDREDAAQGDRCAQSLLVPLRVADRPREPSSGRRSPRHRPRRIVEGLWTRVGRDRGRRSGVDVLRRNAQETLIRTSAPAGSADRLSRQAVRAARLRKASTSSTASSASSAAGRDGLDRHASDRARTEGLPTALCTSNGDGRDPTMRQLMIAAIRKELLLQWRTRAQFMSVFVFGATALLLFSFGVGPDSEMLRKFSAGFLWLGLLLSSTLTLAESFHAEMENRALEGLLLLPLRSARAVLRQGDRELDSAHPSGDGAGAGHGRPLRRGNEAGLRLVGVVRARCAAGLSAPGTLCTGP